MSIFRARASFGLLLGVSALALAMPGAAAAQTQPEQDEPAPQDTPGNPSTGNEGEAIVVTGIRGSLKQSMDIKKNSSG